MSSANPTTLNELPQIMDSLIQFLMVTRTDSEGLITYTNNNFLSCKRLDAKTYFR